MPTEVAGLYNDLYYQFGTGAFLIVLMSAWLWVTMKEKKQLLVVISARDKIIVKKDENLEAARADTIELAKEFQQQIRAMQEQSMHFANQILGASKLPSLVPRD